MRLDLILAMRDIYINSNLNPLTKLTSSSTSTEFKDHDDHPNQIKISHKQCDVTGHPVVNVMESQWKLRQQHDQNFSIKKKLLSNKYQHQKK